MENTSEKILVDTLFGTEEKIVDKNFYSDYVEELPQYLFEDVDENQIGLPLISVPIAKTKIITQNNLNILIPFLNELSLYENRWNLKKTTETREVWATKANQELAPILNSLKEICLKEKILTPRSIYAYFQAKRSEKGIKIYKKETEEILEIPLPIFSDGSSIADKFSNKEFKPIALIASCMGKNATDIAKQWLLSGHNDQFQYLDGFIREMTFAMIEYTTYLINKQECCLGQAVSLGMAKTGNPRIQSTIIDLLDANRIDISFSRHYLMGPEYSALAFVLPK